MKKYLLIFLIALVCVSCKNASKNVHTDNEGVVVADSTHYSWIPFRLSVKMNDDYLENEEAMYEIYDRKRIALLAKGAFQEPYKIECLLPYSENMVVFADGVEALKKWLSEDSVWGLPEEIRCPKNLSDLRKNIKMKDKKGVCIISKLEGGNKKSYATLWTGHNVIGEHSYIANDSIIYFWELKGYGGGFKANIACIYHLESKICGLHKEQPALCKHHEAKNRGSNLTLNNNTKVIEVPTYNSQDEAAMAAANIIRYCMLMDGEVEYGIAIYKDEECDKYHLTQTRKGTKKDVMLDDEIGKKGENGLRLVNGKQYSFVAHVHAHPTIPPPAFQDKGIVGERYQRIAATQFSDGDYLNYYALRCHGYLVANEDGWIIKRFTLPTTNTGNINNVVMRNYLNAFESAINSKKYHNAIRDIVRRRLLHRIVINPVDENQKEISEVDWKTAGASLLVGTDIVNFE